MGQDQFETLLTFFKTLGNESRLKIVGILANRECTVSELSELLNLKEPTVSQHLDMLKHNGLVNMRPEGNFRHYSLNPKALHEMSKDLFNREQLASLVGKVDSFDEVGDEFERKVLKTFIDGERITQLPASEKKFAVVVKWLAEKFEEGVQYTEKEVNAMIKRHHEDSALLRREMVDRRYMRREKGIYWRLPAPSES